MSFGDTFPPYLGAIISFNTDSSHNWYQYNKYVVYLFDFYYDGFAPTIGNNGKVYVVGGYQEKMLLAFNTDGSEKWRFSTTGEYISPPIVDSEETIYFWGYGEDDISYLYALNLDGSVKWRLKGDFRSPVIGENRTLYVCSYNSLYAIGEADPVIFNLHIEPEQSTFTDGDSFELLLDLKTYSHDVSADIYFVMLNETTGVLYFAPGWGTEIKLAIDNIFLPADLSLSDATLLNITLPSNRPPITQHGRYTFAIAAAKPGTADMISDVATVSFMYE